MDAAPENKIRFGDLVFREAGELPVGKLWVCQPTVEKVREGLFQ